jgi:rubrerythrin
VFCCSCGARLRTEPEVLKTWECYECGIGFLGEAGACPVCGGQLHEGRPWLLKS